MTTAHSTDLDHVRRSWEHFGATDPMWAVLTEPGTEGQKWNPDAFFKRGREEIDELLHMAQVTGWKLPYHGRALDFGCGVGRLTRALAVPWQPFSEVHGYDIAQSMLTEAQRHLTDGQRQIITYHHLAGDALPRPEEIGRFDFVVSAITLQHNPVPLALSFIRQLTQLTAPDGVFVFDFPSEPLAAVGYHRGQVSMDMYGASPSVVTKHVRSVGGTVLDIRYHRGQSEWSDVWISFRYVIKGPQ